MCPRLASARTASGTRWAAPPCSQVHSKSAAHRPQPHNLPHRINLALVDEGQLARSAGAGRQARQQPPRQLVPLGPHSPRPPLHAVLPATVCAPVPCPTTPAATAASPPTAVDSSFHPSPADVLSVFSWPLLVGASYFGQPACCCASANAMTTTASPLLRQGCCAMPSTSPSLPASLLAVSRQRHQVHSCLDGDAAAWQLYGLQQHLKVGQLSVAART